MVVYALAAQPLLEWTALSVGIFIPLRYLEADSSTGCMGWSKQEKVDAHY